MSRDKEIWEKMDETFASMNKAFAEMGTEETNTPMPREQQERLWRAMDEAQEQIDETFSKLNKVWKKAPRGKTVLQRITARSRSILKIFKS